MAAESGGGESRFEKIEATYRGAEYISISPGRSRFSLPASEHYFDGVGSVTPRYDSDADELAFVRYPGGKGVRSINDRKLGLDSILNTPQIGIRLTDLSEGYRIPVEYDDQEDVPYIRLDGLREHVAKQGESDGE